MRRIVLIAHNLRSSHNVGSLLRTAEGLGIEAVFFTGYTPYPRQEADGRLPHLAAKLDKQIHKTALGAEMMIAWRHVDLLDTVITDLREDGFVIAGLEQTVTSIALPVPDRIALIVGREVEGIEPAVLQACDVCLEIPMFGHKESYNVVQAAAMALYVCTFS
jgi:23S rRNA (guanosine2251-2'-O)-methyltransferase